MLREGREVGIKLVEVLVDGSSSVSVEMEGSPSLIGVFVDNGTKLVREQIGRLRTAVQPAPTKFRPWL